MFSCQEFHFGAFCYSGILENAAMRVALCYATISHSMRHRHVVTAMHLVGGNKNYCVASSVFERPARALRPSGIFLPKLRSALEYWHSCA